MNTHSVTSWILLSYFAPFATFFFGVFWLGLNVWMFIGGTFVVSMMTLFLYLAFKNWQFDISRMLAERESKPTPIAATVIQTHPITNLVKTTLDDTPICTLALCEEEHLQTLKSAHATLQEEHVRIVEAYEKEREKLFDECTKQNGRIRQNEQVEISQKQALEDAERKIAALSDEIENLKFEIKTLLKMDRELLSACVSEEQFLR
jgi:predicted RNase H-like nuclease (RuvC/YqgF family)